MQPDNKNKSKTTNPFAGHVVFSDPKMEFDESLDTLIRNIKEVNDQRWRFMSPLQIFAMPFEWLFSKLIPHRDPVNIYDVDFEEESPFIELDEFFVFEERRRHENARLRATYDRLHNRVRYHMMPKTVETKKVDVA